MYVVPSRSPVLAATLTSKPSTDEVTKDVAPAASALLGYNTTNGSVV